MPEKSVKSSNNSQIYFRSVKSDTFSKKIIETEIALYKANDTIKKLEQRLAAVSKKNKQLDRKYRYYKSEYEKLKAEDNQTNLSVRHIVLF